jgi:dehydrogenase/reductase SDR family protein 12
VALADVIDALVEAPIGPSFTRVGYEVRSRLEHWRALDSYRADGRVVVLTGATSGLGLAAAEQLARCGATVVLIGRDAERCERVRSELSARTGNTSLSTLVADLGDLAAVRGAAAELQRRYSVIDVLVHNAGALSAHRQQTADGLEATVASQVVGPFLLTALLLEQLRAARSGRVITMSSGGMYASALEVDKLQMGDDYRGAEQYARAKRAQVTLNEMWAAHPRTTGVTFHAVHPGWADTPGVAASLPTFRRVVGPLLRSPGQGADTMAWLALDDAASEVDGRFWLDRRQRPIHRLPTTRRSDTPERRRALWNWCAQVAGLDPQTLAELPR